MYQVVFWPITLIEKVQIKQCQVAIFDSLWKYSTFAANQVHSHSSNKSMLNITKMSTTFTENRKLPILCVCDTVFVFTENNVFQTKISRFHGAFHQNMACICFKHQINKIITSKSSPTSQNHYPSNTQLFDSNNHSISQFKTPKFHPKKFKRLSTITHYFMENNKKWRRVNSSKISISC